MTNLTKLIKALNWQGGTIHQVSEELQRVGLSKSLTSVDSLLKCNDNALSVLISLYSAKK